MSAILFKRAFNDAEVSNLYDITGITTYLNPNSLLGRLELFLEKILYYLRIKGLGGKII